MKITSYLTSVLEESGNQVEFFLRFVRNVFRNGFEWNEFIRQCYVIGYKSIGIVVLTGFILGFVLTLQSLPTLKNFGAQNYVPSMVSISMIR
ncbi:MAG TPA: ABC transporter permease, partial [Sediminibacterium sp.]